MRCLPRLPKSEMPMLNVAMLSSHHPYRNPGGTYSGKTLSHWSPSRPPAGVHSCFASSLSPLFAGFEENESNLPRLVAKAVSRKKRWEQRGGCRCPSCFGRRWSRVKENEHCSLSCLLMQHEVKSSMLRPVSLVSGTSSVSPLWQCLMIKISYIIRLKFCWTS